MSIERKSLCEMKIFQLQAMSNSITYIDKRIVFKNFGISCLALIFNLSNFSTKILHAKKKLVQGCYIWQTYIFFERDWYKLTAQWLRQVIMSLVTWVRFQQEAETLCLPLAILCSIEPVRALPPMINALFLYINLGFRFRLIAKLEGIGVQGLRLRVGGV